LVGKFPNFQVSKYHIFYLEEELDQCDLCLVIGTSSIVYPAAMFAPQVAERGVTVAEFNMEATPATHHFG
jgi:NAD-dependent deacetylase sirtuin 5